MTDGSRHLARRTAIQALYQWALTEQAPDEIERNFINDHDFTGVDVGYFHHLVRNVALYKREIDSRLSPHVDRDLDTVDLVERTILRVGAYELEYEPTVPARVVLDEAVELCKQFGSDNGFRFVNAVLDKLIPELRPA